MGSGGCGKTMMLRMLAGLEVPSEGEIRLGAKRINELSTLQRDTLMVWQSLALFPFLTVKENVEFDLRMRRGAKAERRGLVDKWLVRMRIVEFADGAWQNVLVGKSVSVRVVHVGLLITTKTIC